MKDYRRYPPQRVIIADPDSPEVVEILRRGPGNYQVRCPQYRDEGFRDPEKAIAVGHGRLTAMTGKAR